MTDTREIVPLCAGCGRIRDARDYWLYIPGYAESHTDVDYEPALCPACQEQFGGMEIEELQWK